MITKLTVWRQSRGWVDSSIAVMLTPALMPSRRIGLPLGVFSIDVRDDFLTALTTEHALYAQIRQVEE